MYSGVTISSSTYKTPTCSYKTLATVLVCAVSSWLIEQEMGLAMNLQYAVVQHAITDSTSLRTRMHQHCSNGKSLAIGRSLEWSSKYLAINTLIFVETNHKKKNHTSV